MWTGSAEVGHPPFPTAASRPPLWNPRTLGSRFGNPWSGQCRWEGTGERGTRSGPLGGPLGSPQSLGGQRWHVETAVCALTPGPPTGFGGPST